MKTMIDDNRGLPPELLAHVRALIDAQRPEIEEECRRYRRRAAVQRNVVMMLTMAFLAVGTAKVSMAYVSQPSTTGVLGSQEAIECVQQILLNQ
ncbi:MAG: hypothetical protein IJ634_02165 [Bacteroidales bacterium]|nr:hypothetical protein [Bacteroidales bacterium]